MEKKRFYTETELKGKKTNKPTKTPGKYGVWGRSYEKEKKLNVSVTLGMQD